MYVVEYDLVISKMKSFEDTFERRLHVFGKFEDALSDYRRAFEMKTPFGKPASKNLKISRANLDEIDVSQFI